jgi:hypothetical protein
VTAGQVTAAVAASLDGFIARIGAVITGRRTYDIARAWEGQGEVPGAPLFVVTHQVPAQVPPADPPYTFVTDGIAQRRGRAQNITMHAVPRPPIYAEAAALTTPRTEGFRTLVWS